MNKDKKSSEVVVLSVRPEERTTTMNTLFISNSSYANTSNINSSGTWIVLECTTDFSRNVQKTCICYTAYRRYFYILDDNKLYSSENLRIGRWNIWDTGQRKRKLEPVSSTSRRGARAAHHDEYPPDFGPRIAYTVSLASEENKSRSRHNVEGSFLCVLYFGWPNQPSSGIMIILHWYVIFMLHVV